MGFTFLTEATKTPPNSAQLQPSMKFCSSGALLCGNISSSAAEAIMPMTTGRMPFMAPSTTGFCFRRRKKRVMSSISVSDGRHTANVASAAPRMPHHALPACAPTV